MGSAGEPTRRVMPLIETGAENEYFITHIAKAEPAANGCLRLYVAQERNGELKLEFTVVGTVQSFAMMARDVLRMASDQHNLALWDSWPTSEN